MTNLLNTHYYDGKLNIHELVIAIQELQKITASELTVEKQALFSKLIADIQHNTSINNRYRSRAVIAINRISQSIRKPANLDRTNNMYADDVLYIVCRKLSDPDSLVYIAEQLSDIITFGQCAQGRSTRIFQVLLTL